MSKVFYSPKDFFEYSTRSWLAELLIKLGIKKETTHFETDTYSPGVTSNIEDYKD